jgi:hypothetical protein
MHPQAKSSATPTCETTAQGLVADVGRGRATREDEVPEPTIQEPTDAIISRSQATMARRPAAGPNCLGEHYARAEGVAPASVLTPYKCRGPFVRKKLHIRRWWQRRPVPIL